MRIWDLEGGLPLACTRALGSTVRCVAADEHLLVAATSHDFAIRAWRPSEVCAPPPSFSHAIFAHDSACVHAVLVRPTIVLKVHICHCHIAHVGDAVDMLSLDFV